MVKVSKEEVDDAKAMLGVDLNTYYTNELARFLDTDNLRDYTCDVTMEGTIKVSDCYNYCEFRESNPYPKWLCDIYFWDDKAQVHRYKYTVTVDEYLVHSVSAYIRAGYESALTFIKEYVNDHKEEMAPLKDLMDNIAKLIEESDIDDEDIKEGLSEIIGEVNNKKYKRLGYKFIDNNLVPGNFTKVRKGEYTLRGYGKKCDFKRNNENQAFFDYKYYVWDDTNSRYHIAESGVIDIYLMHILITYLRGTEYECAKAVYKYDQFYGTIDTSPLPNLMNKAVDIMNKQAKEYTNLFEVPRSINIDWDFINKEIGGDD